MKLNERIVFVAICAVPMLFLLVVLYKEVTYIKTLKTELEFENETDFNIVYEDHPKNVMKAFTKEILDTLNSIISTVSDTPPTRENLFKDLHKYSVYNPNFRTYLEWPPFFTLSPYNPNLAEMWNETINDEWPNHLKFQYRISKHYLYEDSPLVDELLHDMATKKIISVENHPGGTQFKLIVRFEDGGRALFKPQRYPKDQEVNENMLYLSDFERHFSEIAAFHLDRILGFRRAPPVVGRKVNVTGELYRLADEELFKTFYLSPDGNYCFHGRCRMYCDTHHGFCGDPHMIEGSFAAFLPPKQFVRQRLIFSPWRRTYNTSLKALWQVDDDYCHEHVLTRRPFNESRRLFDAIDCAVFDYLIGNEDRHSYDEFTIFGDDNTPTFIHMDNGRGFGKSYHDERSILMPLIQCCVVRLSTFNRLYSFHAGPRPLSDLMRESLAKDPLSPILTEAHLKALDRRVGKILHIIRLCIDLNGPDIVLLDDMLDY